MTSFYKPIFDAFHYSRVEPKKRLCGGRFGWAIHRFPIKGGISIAVVLAENIRDSNTLLERLKAKEIIK